MLYLVWDVLVYYILTVKSIDIKFRTVTDLVTRQLYPGSNGPRSVHGITPSLLEEGVVLSAAWMARSRTRLGTSQALA